MAIILFLSHDCRLRRHNSEGEMFVEVGIEMPLSVGPPMLVLK